jgi:tungstate transport system substrate-binding protein
MKNYFVVLGPSNDPAKAKGLKPAEAFALIAEGKHKFVSRGDDSGTHKKELSLWNATTIKPNWNGYVESGQGMGATLTMADEMQAYVLADEATYANFKSKIQSVPLVQRCECLDNPYAVILVSQSRHAELNAAAADQFVDFLLCQRAQRLIAEYRLAGEQLFLPTRLEMQD